MFETSKVLPYPADFLKEIVADVECYPQFLPWVKAVAIHQKNPEFFEADLTIGYGLLEKTYRSEVFIYTDAVEAKAISNNIFKFLETRWQFTTKEEKCCLVNLTIDFQLQSQLLQLTVGKMLDDAANKMIAAFEHRAASLWKNIDQFDS